MPLAGSSARILDLEDATIEEFEPASYPIGDSLEDQIYATYSKQLLQERREAMESQFQTWIQNLLFLAGLQWWRYDRLTNQFMEVRGPSWKERPVRNLLVPFFKFTLAKLTKNRPRMSSVPASTDPEDVHAAELGDDVLRGKWVELRLSKVIRRTLAWMLSTGNAYVMPYWNTASGIFQPLTTLVSAGKFDSATGEFVGEETVECPCDENGDPIMDEEGRYDLEAEPAYVDIGEVGYKVLSPFQVFVDTDAQGDEDVHSVIIVEPIPLRDIKRRWPDATDLQAEDVSEIDRFDNIVVGLSSGADTHMTGAQYERDETAVPKGLVIHYFEEPSPQYPLGRNWVTVGDQCLERPGPLPDGIWPVIVHFKDVEVPGRYHGDATMTSAVGLQREYNEVNGQIKEHHNLLLRGKWLVPIGSNIRRGQITAAPGEVIQHTPGLKPEMADLKPLPQQVYQERDRILADLQYITGAHKVSMGDAPPGVTAGRAFLILQEADDSDLGPTIEMLEEACADLGWLTLQIIQRYYEEERLVRVAGENRRYRVRAFKGADLESIVDVEPQVGSAFPWSHTAKQSMMIDLVQAVPDLFMDEETGQFDRDAFRRMLPVGGEEAVTHEADLDIAEALREEEDFQFWDGLSDLPIEPLPWQDHITHLRQHSRTLKSAAFRKWPPDAQTRFIEHWMNTQVLIQEMQAAAMAAEAEAQGGDQPPEEST